MTILKKYGGVLFGYVLGCFSVLWLFWGRSGQATKEHNCFLQKAPVAQSLDKMVKHSYSRYVALAKIYASKNQPTTSDYFIGRALLPLIVPGQKNRTLGHTGFEASDSAYLIAYLRQLEGPLLPSKSMMPLLISRDNHLLADAPGRYVGFWQAYTPELREALMDYVVRTADRPYGLTNTLSKKDLLDLLCPLEHADRAPFFYEPNGNYPYYSSPLIKAFLSALHAKTLSLSDLIDLINRAPLLTARCPEARALLDTLLSDHLSQLKQHFFLKKIHFYSLQKFVDNPYLAVDRLTPAETEVIAWAFQQIDPIHNASDAEVFQKKVRAFYDKTQDQLPPQLKEALTSYIDRSQPLGSLP